ncbi:hypothetical protein N864_21915 [Intrasporangium chromatireducens Q5-1]|uniref:Uncharacterized protein n=2 Tax=Intrasporangium TaxID=53357 RepID=W9GJF8_9MICO|nr:hypothetical protein N864_21915 [Intrasporangium chromatireducens Q5-1]
MTDRVADAGSTIQQQMSSAKDSAKATAAVLADRASAVADQAADLAASSRSGAGDVSASTRETARETAASLRDVAATLREAAGPTLHDASDLARERWTMAKEAAAPAVHEAVDRARPKVEAAQSTLLENVLPKVSAAITTAAASLSEAKEGAAPYVEHARETAHVGNERARGALKVLKGEATVKERRSKGKWLIGIGLVAAIVAAVAAFRQKQQTQDPWATPLTDPTSPSFKDRAAERVGGLVDAKDHTGELGESDLLGGGAAGTASVGVTAPAETVSGVDGGVTGSGAGVGGAGNAEMDADQVAADELDDEAADEDENGRGV